MTPAGFGRRLIALVLDWVVALLGTRLIFRDLEYGGNEFGFAALAVFFAEVTLLTWLLGSSFGQLVMRIRVTRLDGGRLGLPRAALRTLLLCLVIPAVVIDSSGRGLHDRAVGSRAMRISGGAAPAGHSSA